MDSQSFRKYLLMITSLLIVVFCFVVVASPDKNLHIIACNVGQGDAILITSGNNQILVDGGPNNSVLSCLGKHMPFWDHTLEMVVLTHPQSDHFTGLIEVFRRYEVDLFLRNELDNLSNQGYQVLRKEVGSQGIKTVLPQSGQRLRLGLIYLDILSPSHGFESRELNDYSIVLSLKYGSFEALLTGDIEGNMDDELVGSGLLEVVDYIKVNHHGSKNGLTEKILSIVNPKVAVISAGKDNRYGHPHKETIDLLNKYQLKILRTDEIGDVEIVSNGTSFWVSK